MQLHGANDTNTFNFQHPDVGVTGDEQVELQQNVCYSPYKTDKQEQYAILVLL